MKLAQPDQPKWRWTYVSMIGGNVLHRIARIDKKYDLDDDGGFEWYSALDGETLCGRRISQAQGMPGLLSRMGAKRCNRCCDLLSIPHGNGIPLNSDIDEPVEIPNPTEAEEATP